MLPFISIIIVNYNGKKWIAPCIDSLLRQTYKNFEIIFVDNASTDDSIAVLKKQYPSVILIKNRINSGFSGGNNIGMQHAKGDYILLLNNDTRVEKNFLKDFMSAFEKLPSASIVQSKIVLMQTPDIIDTCGSYWTDSSFLYHFGNGKNALLPLYNTARKVFSVKGASVLIKREVIEKVGLFDEDTWCYYEETDFCHRAWLAGYESWYWPHATLYHAQGGTSLTFPNHIIQFHNFKNKLLSFLKNFEKKTLLSVLPLYIGLNICISFLWLLKGKYKHVLSLYKAIGWNCIKYTRTYRKRIAIQKERRKSDKDIFTDCKKNPRIIYYRYLFTDTIKDYRD